MKNSNFVTRCIKLMILPLILSLGFGVAWAHSPTEGVREILIKANHEGFFDSEGLPLREISVQKGKTVRLVFQYDESAVDAYKTGNRHQFAIASEDTDFRTQSDEISFWNKKATVDLTPGEDGSNQYRIVCILDCVGMEQLGYLVHLTLVVA